MHKLIWNDLTPLGKWTIGIPLILLVYAVAILALPLLVLLYLLVKSGILDRVERGIDRFQRLFVKGDE